MIIIFRPNLSYFIYFILLSFSIISVTKKISVFIDLIIIVSEFSRERINASKILSLCDWDTDLNFILPIFWIFFEFLVWVSVCGLCERWVVFLALFLVGIKMLGGLKLIMVLDLLLLQVHLRFLIFNFIFVFNFILFIYCTVWILQEMVERIHQVMIN